MAKRGGNRDGGTGTDVPEPTPAAIEPIEIQEEMERSFLEYSMSVIVSRALPDVRDGLKPVHRRILYSMYEQGLRPDRSRTKCAKAVGEVMGNFHPHGDTAIYDALARMAQDFSLRHVLIDGHGNFGGRGPEEGPAAMRYTECRLAPLAMEMLAGIDEDTVDFVPNYDGSTEEPVVLPARFPNLLVNGSQGIAVGMATNIPPHNLGEVIDAVVHVLENPDATPDDLMAFVKGPDFPTGAQILGRQGILDAYRTGQGLDQDAGPGRDGREPGRHPHRGHRHPLPDLDRGHRAEDRGAGQRRDPRRHLATSRTTRPAKMPRLVIDAQARRQRQRGAQQPLQAHAPADQLPREHGGPGRRRAPHAQPGPVRLLLRHHQIEVVTRRSEFRLKKARERAHIVEGLLRAIDMLDAVIAAIRASDDRRAASTALMAEPFSFSEQQAEHILDMTLGRLTRLGRTNLEEEMEELRATIAELESILGDPARLRAVIATELGEIRSKYANDRRTIVTHDPGELGVEDLISDEEIVVTMTRAGYIKAVPAGSFRTQGRGGRGVQGARLKEEDLVDDVVHTTTLAFLLLFSNRGRVYRLRAHEVPMKERTARGTAVVNLLPLSPSEKIQAIVATKDFDSGGFLTFATKMGQVKKTAFTEYDKSRREGFIAIALRDGDELVRVVATSGDDDIVMVSLNGSGIRFSENDVRAMGRDAAGVRGMRLRAGDEVVSCDVVRPDNDILIVTDAGYGKRTKADHFGRQGRGGQGVRAIKLTARRGRVVAAFMAGLDDEILLISTGGIVIRTAVREIAAQGRDATGVRLMSLEEGHSVAAVAAVTGEEDE